MSYILLIQFLLSTDKTVLILSTTVLILSTAEQVIYRKLRLESCPNSVGTVLVKFRSMIRVRAFMLIVFIIGMKQSPGTGENLPRNCSILNKDSTKIKDTEDCQMR